MVEGIFMEKLPSVVSDIMSSPVITVKRETNVRDASILMIDKKIGCLIVTEMNNPVGIVTKSDIIKRVVILCLDPCEVKMGDVMSTPLITIGKNLGILAAMRKMREMAVTQLVVMEGEKMVGIVSERDVLGGVSIASLASFSTLMKN
jgi:CBS domain-containing protein